jgi:hypothetical protein
MTELMAFYLLADCKLSVFLSRKQVYPPSPGTNSTVNKGVGESQFQRLEKKLSALFILWYNPSTDG